LKWLLPLRYPARSVGPISAGVGTTLREGAPRVFNIGTSRPRCQYGRRHSDGTVHSGLGLIVDSAAMPLAYRSCFETKFICRKAARERLQARIGTIQALY
jgi:hypothetical protein